MKTLTLIPILALATTSFANLGETLPELKARFKDYEYRTHSVGEGETVHIFTGKNQEVRAILSRRGVSVREFYNMSTFLTSEHEIDLAKAAAPGNTWHTSYEAGSLESDNGRIRLTLTDTKDGYKWSACVEYTWAGREDLHHEKDAILKAVKAVRAQQLGK